MRRLIVQAIADEPLCLAEVHLTLIFFTAREKNEGVSMKYMWEYLVCAV